MKFVIIDADAQRRLLVVATLARHFPHAVLMEAEDLRTARLALKRADAVIGLATPDMDAELLVRVVREIDERMPLLILADAENKEATLAEGANAFLRREEWLLVGTTLGRILNPSGYCRSLV